MQTGDCQAAARGSCAPARLRAAEALRQQSVICPLKHLHRCGRGCSEAKPRKMITRSSAHSLQFRLSLPRRAPGLSVGAAPATPEGQMPEFETRLTLPQPREKVFDFLIRTENLLQMIPPESQMRPVSVPEILQLGSRLEFAATAFGQSLKIIHQITDFEAPHRLTEEQIQGLFKRFVHV